MFNRPFISKLLFLIGAYLFSSIVFSSCNSTDSENNDNSDCITIGAVFNETGWMAAYDQPTKKAVVLAIKHINQNGGILGKECKLIEFDGKTDPAEVANATEKLIEMGAEIIIAPGDFDIGGPACLKTQENGLVGLSAIATSTKFGSSELGDKQFTIAMWNNTMGASIAEYGFENRGWQNAWILTDTTIDYSRELSKYFAEQFTSIGGNLFGEIKFSQNDTDFTDIINTIQSFQKSADVIYISSYSPGLLEIIKQIRNSGISVPIAGGDTYDDRKLFDELGSDLGYEIYFATHSWLGSGLSDNMDQFISLYKNEYGHEAESSFIVMGWDLIQLLKKAIESNGSTNGESLALQMVVLNYDLLSGNLKWESASEGHQPLKSAAIIKLTSGEAEFISWWDVESPPKP